MQALDDTTTAEQKKGKVRIPKPGKTHTLRRLGSKKYQSAKKELLKVNMLQPPLCYLLDGVVILLFINQHSLIASFARVQEEYEHSKLNGPLKGVNMPFQFWICWRNRQTFLLPAEIFIEKIVSQLFPDSFTSPLEITEYDSESTARCTVPLPLYLIACLAGDSSSLLHEWAHAIFWKTPPYRELAQDYWESLDCIARIAIEKELIARGYHPDVFVDEYQAYVLESAVEFGKRWKLNLIASHVKFRSLVSAPTLPFPERINWD